MRVATHSFLDGFAAARAGREVHDLSHEQILRSLDPDPEPDPGLTPWRRSHHAGIRAALNA